MMAGMRDVVTQRVKAQAKRDEEQAKRDAVQARREEAQAKEDEEIPKIFRILSTVLQELLKDRRQYSTVLPRYTDAAVKTRRSTWSRRSIPPLLPSLTPVQHSIAFLRQRYCNRRCALLQVVSEGQQGVHALDWAMTDAQASTSL